MKRQELPPDEQPTITFAVPFFGTVTLAPDGRLARAAGARAKKPAFKAKTVEFGPGLLKFKPKLSKASKRKLKRKGKLKLGIAATITPGEGGEPITSRQKVTLIKGSSGPRDCRSPLRSELNSGGTGGMHVSR
jgi:hypothetical protein